MQPSQHRLYKTIGILFLSGAAVFSFIGFLHNFTGRGEGNFYWAGVWASKHSGDKIGMQQSGTASFMSNNVVNLDGKVNAAVLDAMKKNERGKYILLNNISYIMDIEPFAKTLVDDAAKYGRVFTLIDSSGLMRIYKRE